MNDNDTEYQRRLGYYSSLDDQSLQRAYEAGPAGFREERTWRIVEAEHLRRQLTPTGTSAPSFVAAPESDPMTEKDTTLDVDEPEYDMVAFERYIGPRWRSYYSDVFRIYAGRGDGVSLPLVERWNWAAFFFQGWFLYRRCYGWFIGLGLATNALLRVFREDAVGTLAVLVASHVVFGAVGNAAVYNRARNVVRESRRHFTSPEERLRWVEKVGGVHKWFGSLWIAGEVVAYMYVATLLV